MHQKSLNHHRDTGAVVHSGEEEWPELLLPDYPSKVFFGHMEEAFKLPDALLADVARGMGGPGPFKKPAGLLVIGLGDIKGVFKGGLVKSLVIHDTSLVPFPG
jgi:hypothetical protein